MCGISYCSTLILSNPLLKSFTPYSLDSTYCNDCRCLARAFEFVPGATANADSLAKVCDCHHVHYVHTLCLPSPWCRLSYKIACSIERVCSTNILTLLLLSEFSVRNLQKILFLPLPSFLLFSSFFFLRRLPFVNQTLMTSNVSNRGCSVSNRGPNVSNRGCYCEQSRVV